MEEHQLLERPTPWTLFQHLNENGVALIDKSGAEIPYPPWKSERQNFVSTLLLLSQFHICAKDLCNEPMIEIKHPMNSLYMVYYYVCFK